MDDRVYIRWRSFEEVEVDMTDRMAMVKNEWRRENYLDDKDISWLIAEIERLKAANTNPVPTDTELVNATMERAAVVAEITVDTRDFHPGEDKQRLGWNNCRRAIMLAIRAEIKT